jgi:hypothetical protein
MILLALFYVFIVGYDDYPPTGTDLSNCRCHGGVVSTGDLARDVLAKCGDPLRTTRLLDEPYQVWVYHFGQANHVLYFAFIHQRLQRIYSIRCRSDNPDCQ